MNPKVGANNMKTKLNLVIPTAFIHFSPTDLSIAILERIMTVPKLARQLESQPRVKNLAADIMSEPMLLEESNS